MLAADTLVFLIGVVSVTIWKLSPANYYLAIQQDGALEWATFWTFLLAGVVFGLAALKVWERGLVSYWFATGLSLFCLVFAFEEI